MRLTPEQAVALGLISQMEADRMQQDSKARSRSSSARQGSPRKASSTPRRDPQQMLYLALCERLPGLPELEKQGLVPGRRFRADIFIRFCARNPGLHAG